MERSTIKRNFEIKSSVKWRLTLILLIISSVALTGARFLSSANSTDRHRNTHSKTPVLTCPHDPDLATQQGKKDLILQAVAFMIFYYNNYTADSSEMERVVKRTVLWWPPKHDSKHRGEYWPCPTQLQRLHREAAHLFWSKGDTPFMYTVFLTSQFKRLWFCFMWCSFMFSLPSLLFV